MTFEIVDTQEAIERPGWRMTIVRGVPSPWGEVVKAMLHIKNIEWTATYLDASDDIQVDWTGQMSAPAVMLDGNKPVSTWTDILFLAERVAPLPSMLPIQSLHRAMVLGFAHEFCGRWGLGWSRRLQLIDAGLQKKGGFAEPVAKYLAAKYGFRNEVREKANVRTIKLLTMFARQLKRQRDQGSVFYFGNSLTYVDLCSAAFMGMFRPLDPDVCGMKDSTRRAFETINMDTEKALDPILIEHRDRIYNGTVPLPLQL